MWSSSWGKKNGSGYVCVEHFWVYLNVRCAFREGVRRETGRSQSCTTGSPTGAGKAWGVELHLVKKTTMLHKVERRVVHLNCASQNWGTLTHIPGFMVNQVESKRYWLGAFERKHRTGALRWGKRRQLRARVSICEQQSDPNKSWRWESLKFFSKHLRTMKYPRPTLSLEIC